MQNHKHVTYTDLSGQNINLCIIEDFDTMHARQKPANRLDRLSLEILLAESALEVAQAETAAALADIFGG